MDARSRLLLIIEQAKGDDLERANHSFGGMTEAELSCQYGCSGYSRREIWERFKKHRAEWAAAKAFLLQLLEEAE